MCVCMCVCVCVIHTHTHKVCTDSCFRAMYVCVYVCVFVSNTHTHTQGVHGFLLQLQQGNASFASGAQQDAEMQRREGVLKKISLGIDAYELISSYVREGTNYYTVIQEKVHTLTICVCVCACVWVCARAGGLVGGWVGKMDKLKMRVNVCLYKVDKLKKRVCVCVCVCVCVQG